MPKYLLEVKHSSLGLCIVDAPSEEALNKFIEREVDDSFEKWEFIDGDDVYNVQYTTMPPRGPSGVVLNEDGVEVDGLD